MKGQINATKIFNSSAIYIQIIKIATSLCKILLMIIRLFVDIYYY